MAEHDVNTEPVNQGPDPDDFRMSFGEHLEELRKRLIWGLLGVGVVACFTFYWGTDIVHWLQAPLFQAQNRLGLPEGTISTSVLTPFAVFMKVSIIAAIVLGSPWLVYQLWKFVEAGLYASERKVVYVLAPFSTIMVVLGVLFMYYILLPISVSFLLYFAQSYPETGGDRPSFLEIISAVSPFSDDEDSDGKQDDGKDKSPTSDEIEARRGNADLPILIEEDPEDPREGQMWVTKSESGAALKLRIDGRTRIIQQIGSRAVLPMIDVKEYIGFIMIMMLGIIIGFQLPVVMLIGGWTGIVPPSFVRKYRRYALFTCFALGALLTPSDPLSMLVLAVPLYLLYEVGIILIQITYRPRGLFWDDEDENNGDNEGDDGSAAQPT